MASGEWTTNAKKSFNRCAQCGDLLFAPVWSEFVRERCIRHLWNCDTCGYAFETTVYLAGASGAKEQIDHAA
jgi:ribosomal protein L37AE/L43A